MSWKARILVLVSLFFAAALRADSVTESVQQKLKDDGFYYGAITGTKDSETVAAIRRYQIRNGLKVSGELDAETQRSLGIKGAASARGGTPAIPRPSPDKNYARSSPPPAPPSTPAPEKSGPMPGYVPGPRGLQPETAGFFDGTPYEVAPPDVQRRVIIGAQTILTRSGLYRSGIDGAFGPGTQAALRLYQSRAGLPPTGLLDMDTLAALGLLPGQRMPGFEPPRRRFYRPRQMIAPNGEPIYTPE